MRPQHNIMKATLQNPYRRHNKRPSSGNAAPPTAAPPSPEDDAKDRPLVVVVRKENVQEESASALVMAASDKAGMEGIDRQRIDAIILRESGDSLYMREQRRRDQQVNARISGLRDKMAHAVPGWEREVHRQLEAEMSAVRAQRPSRSYAVVVDVSRVGVALFWHFPLQSLACSLFTHTLFLRDRWMPFTWPANYCRVLL